jgi:hypothetical protein
MNAIQEELALFEPPSFERLLDKTQASALSIELSNRLRSSWHVKYCAPGNQRRLVIPAIFGAAPASIKKALIEWAMLPRARRTRAAQKRKRDLERMIWEYYRRECPAPRKQRREDPARLSRDTRGCRYDLREVCQTINQRYFQNAIVTIIRWGSYASLTSYQSRKIDLQGKPFFCITIAGVYDHPDVPRCAIEAIVYHEMLHIAIPPRSGNGRTIIHGPEFRRAERAFPHYRQWRDWEAEALRRIHRAMKRRARTKGTRP